MPSFLKSLRKYERGSGVVLSSRLHSDKPHSLLLFLSLVSIPRVPLLYSSLLLKAAVYAQVSAGNPRLLVLTLIIQSAFFS